MNALLNNDILLKGACYGLLSDLVDSIPGKQGIGFLGAAKFVLTKRLKNMRLRGDPIAVEARLLSFLAGNVIEPTTEEMRLASELETIAQRLAVNLNAGESQLVAVLVLRGINWLLTGDKRAVIAVERMLDIQSQLMAAAGKVLCLEQLVRRLLVDDDPTPVRNVICAEPNVDRSLNICFSCTCQNMLPSSVIEGLNSYVADLRSQAPRVLAT